VRVWLRPDGDEVLGGPDGRAAPDWLPLDEAATAAAELELRAEVTSTAPLRSVRAADGANPGDAPMWSTTVSTVSANSAGPSGGGTSDLEDARSALSRAGSGEAEAAP